MIYYGDRPTPAQTAAIKHVQVLRTSRNCRWCAHFDSRWQLMFDLAMAGVLLRADAWKQLHGMRSVFDIWPILRCLLGQNRKMSKQNGGRQDGSCLVHGGVCCDVGVPFWGNYGEPDNSISISLTANHDGPLHWSCFQNSGFFVTMQKVQIDGCSVPFPMTAIQLMLMRSIRGNSLLQPTTFAFSPGIRVPPLHSLKKTLFCRKCKMDQNGIKMVRVCQLTNSAAVRHDFTCAQFLPDYKVWSSTRCKLMYITSYHISPLDLEHSVAVHNLAMTRCMNDITIYLDKILYDTVYLA